MKPLKLRISNIRAYESAELDFTPLTAAAIVGTNGAGKSTLMECIVNGLFMTSNSILPADMIRQGAKCGSIELEYSHNGHIYRIIRTCGSRSILEFHTLVSDEWQPLTCSTARETQEKINASLGMDSALFLATSAVMQDSAGGICAAKPSERKALMYKIYAAELDRYALLELAAKARVKAFDTDISTNRGQLATYSSTAGSIDALREQLAYNTSELETARVAENIKSKAYDTAKAAAEAAEAKQKRFREAMDEAAACRVSKNRAEQDIRTLEETIREGTRALEWAGEIAAAEKRIPEHEARIATLQKQKDERAALSNKIEQEKRKESETRYIEDTEQNAIRSEIDKATKAIEEAERAVNYLETLPCASNTELAGACMLLSDARAKAAKLDEHKELEGGLRKTLHEKAETIANNRRQRLAAHEALVLDYNNNTFNSALLSDTEEALRTDRDTLNRRAAMATAEANINHARESIEARKKEIADLDAKHEALQIETGALMDELENVPNADVLQSAKSSLNEARDQVELYVAKVAGIEEKIKTAQDAAKACEQLQDDISVLESNRSLAATLQKAWGRDGIPAYIIDSAIPRIEEYANDILAQLSNGRMFIEMKTQREKADKALAETLDIVVTDPIGQRSIENFSGGEKLRIYLAVRIAIGLVLAERAGSSVRTLILDEVCSPLDAAGEAALVDCINILQSRFDLILLITHRDSIKDLMPARIEIYSTAEGSKLRLS